MNIQEYCAVHYIDTGFIEYGMARIDVELLNGGGALRFRECHLVEFHVCFNNVYLRVTGVEHA